MHRVRNFVLLHLLILVLLALFVWKENRLVPLPSAGLAEGKRLQCASYSPYRNPGQSPLNPGYVVPVAQIEEDLRVLAQRFECVRIYSIDQGLDQVPRIAREVGLKVLLGVWVGRDAVKNDEELAHGIALANANADVVQAMIVGNEVLLRQEQTEAGLKALIERAKASVKVPVTYADVWEFWLQYAALASSVDFVTVHILPYWEDNPEPVETAVEHVRQVVERVEQSFHKPVLIGETGWPSIGRQREGSRPSQVNQARYMREFVREAEAKGWRYNLIESTDQPWKRWLEGTVGGYWGIYDVGLNEKFGFDGPVANRHNAVQVAWSVLAGVLICGLIAWSGAVRVERPRLMAIGVMGAVAGAVTALQVEHMYEAYRVPTEWATLGGTTLLMIAMLWAMTRFVARPTALPKTEHALEAIKGFLVQRQRGKMNAGQCLVLLRLLLLYAASVGALLIAVDPRYRDFPVWLYLLPALELGIGLRLLLNELPAASHDEHILAWVILVASVVRWMMEPLNPQAVIWGAVGAAMACSVLFSSKRDVAATQAAG